MEQTNGLGTQFRLVLMSHDRAMAQTVDYSGVSVFGLGPVRNIKNQPNALNSTDVYLL